MSDFENYLEFEKRKHNDFFIPYYNSRGWEVLQDNLGQNTDWDIKLLMDGEEKTTDEKARMKDWGDFLVEIVQDLKTGNKGWLFKPKDFYFYASWNDMDKKEPTSFYIVDAKLLQDFVLCNWKKLIEKMEISERGWGTTLFVKIGWQDLLFTKVANKIL